MVFLHSNASGPRSGWVKMAIIGRRQLIAGLGGAVVTWSLTARAQRVDRVRRVGVLMSRAAGDPEEQARFAGFLQGLQKLGLDRRRQRADRQPLGCGRSRCINSYGGQDTAGARLTQERRNVDLRRRGRLRRGKRWRWRS